jgi:hypothetical protein
VISKCVSESPLEITTQNAQIKTHTLNILNQNCIVIAESALENVQNW